MRRRKHLIAKFYVSRLVDSIRKKHKRYCRPLETLRFPKRAGGHFRNWFYQSKTQRSYQEDFWDERKCHKLHWHRWNLMRAVNFYVSIPLFKVFTSKNISVEIFICFRPCRRNLMTQNFLKSLRSKFFLPLYWPSF